jgi:hypothetical protein
MGKYLNTNRRPLLRIRITNLNYRALLALCGSVIAGLTAAVTLYPTPNPTLVELTALQTALQTAMKGLGTKKNKGSHASVVACRNAANNLKEGLILELSYVLNTITLAQSPQSQADQLAFAGFAFRKVKAISRAMQIPTFTRQTNNRSVPQSLGQIKWRRPLGLIKGARASSYAIYIGNGVVPASYVKTVTKTNAFFPQPVGTATLYTIVPFNSRGTGIPFQITVR